MLSQSGVSMKLLEDLPVDMSIKLAAPSLFSSQTMKFNPANKVNSSYSALTGVQRIDPQDLLLLDLEGTKPLSLISKQHQTLTLENTAEGISFDDKKPQAPSRLKRGYL